MNSGYFTIREGSGVEARRLKRVLIDQRQIVFFGFMLLSSLYSVGASASGLRAGPSQWPTNSCNDLLQLAFRIVRTHPAFSILSLARIVLDANADVHGGKRVEILSAAAARSAASPFPPCLLSGIPSKLLPSTAFVRACPPSRCPMPGLVSVTFSFDPSSRFSVTF